MKKNRILKIITVLIPFIFGGILLIVHININSIKAELPVCLFNRITGCLCPACGNTRSVVALMNGDIITSLRYNISPFVISLILLLLYIELVTKTFGKHKKILPRSNIFWFTVLGLVFVYFFIRNFLPFPL